MKKKRFDEIFHSWFAFYIDWNRPISFFTNLTRTVNNSNNWIKPYEICIDRLSFCSVYFQLTLTYKLFLLHRYRPLLDLLPEAAEMHLLEGHPHSIQGTDGNPHPTQPSSRTDGPSCASARHAFSPCASRKPWWRKTSCRNEKWKKARGTDDFAVQTK